MPHRASAIIIFTAVLLTAVPPARAASPNGSHAALSPSLIFDRALGFARTQSYPPYVSFVVTVRTSTKGKWLVEEFQSLCRTRDDRVVTDAKPLSTTSKPENPYKFTLKTQGMAIRDSTNIEEPFGLPEMSPIFPFGLTSLRPASSPAREYDVTLLGLESLHNHKVYHLALAPLLQPTVYRIRDLWVDAGNFAIWKLTSAGVFRSGPATGVNWDVEYVMTRGRWLIESESTSASMLLGGYAPVLNSYIPMPGATLYDGVTYTFSNVDFPKTARFQFFEFRSSQAMQM